LSNLSRSQQTIFLAIFLAVSLLGNIFLFNGNNAKASLIVKQSSQLTKLTSEIEILNAQLAEHERKVKESETTLSSVGGQQRELQAIAKEMQAQLNEITKAYQNSLKTAEQTKEQLNAAESQRIALEKHLAEQESKFQEAQKIINNQQRQLRTQSDTSGNTEEQFQNQQVLGLLSSQLQNSYPDVLFRQTQSGAGVIEVPLEYLFESDTTKLTPDSTKLLKVIADSLLNVSEAEIEIIGHSDSRPIISELGLIYPTNWELSSARASKVAQQLQEAGINEHRMTVLGKAANVPVRDESNAEAWRINRRIEIRFN
jgi:flagellar motor protein MotB